MLATSAPHKAFQASKSYFQLLVSTRSLDDLPYEQIEILGSGAFSLVRDQQNIPLAKAPA